MKNNLFKKDLFRYYERSNETLKERLFSLPEIKYLRCFRKANNTSNKISKIYYKLRLRKLSLKTQIQIPIGTQIDGGFYIGHFGRIIINKNAIIGKNTNISTGVTIGAENRGKRAGSPTLKGNCWIGSNVVIVGNVNIGSDVLIAPNTYVNFDVPDHSIVIGNPGKIISRENATEKYVEHIV